MAQSIQRQLEEIEVKQKELEDQGVRLERTLRGEEGGIIAMIVFDFEAKMLMVALLIKACPVATSLP